MECCFGIALVLSLVMFVVGIRAFFRRKFNFLGTNMVDYPARFCGALLMTPLAFVLIEVAIQSVFWRISTESLERLFFSLVPSIFLAVLFLALWHKRQGDLVRKHYLIAIGFAVWFTLVQLFVLGRF